MLLLGLTVVACHPSTRTSGPTRTQPDAAAECADASAHGPTTLDAGPGSQPTPDGGASPRDLRWSTDGKRLTVYESIEIDLDTWHGEEVGAGARRQYHYSFGRITSDLPSTAPRMLEVVDPTGTHVAWLEASELCVAELPGPPTRRRTCSPPVDDLRPERRLRAARLRQDLATVSEVYVAGNDACERWPFAGELPERWFSTSRRVGDATETMTFGVRLPDPFHVMLLGPSRRLDFPDGRTASYALGCMSTHLVTEATDEYIAFESGYWYLSLAACKRGLKKGMIGFALFGCDGNEN